LANALKRGEEKLDFYLTIIWLESRETKEKPAFYGMWKRGESLVKEEGH
jgi:hypothetical protein